MARLASGDDPEPRALYEDTKDPARIPRTSVCQARNAIMFRFRFGNEQAR